MQVLDDCSQQDFYYGRGSSHGVKDSITASIKSLETEFCGLILDSFLPETQSKKKAKNLTKTKKKEKKKGKDNYFYEKLG